MHESYYKIGTTYSFMRHSTLLPARKTLLFLHGIGDSSISYLPFFQANILSQFNILIPDLLGYGKSSQHNDYSFKFQVKLLMKHIKSLEKKAGFLFDSLILIPHSMASIHAMLLCESALKNQIKAVINVEGSITQYGSFISDAVSKIALNRNFEDWFREFKESTIFGEFIKKFPVCRSYYASLQFCQPRAFLQNALEIHQVCISQKGEYTNIAGKQFSELNLPKIYCYGDKSICQESLDFLYKKHLPVKVFNTNNHFVMEQCFDEFTAFMVDWIKKTV